MTAERFGLYTGSLVHSGGTLNFAQLESFGAAMNANKSPITPAGTVDAAHIGMASAQPQISLGTRDLAGFFTTVSIVNGLKATGAVDFYYQEREDCQTFVAAATLTHLHWSCAGNGLLYPTSISASQDDQNGAIVQARFDPLWNGSVDPIVLNDAVAISAEPTPAFNSRFWLGPIYHNSAQLKGITQWNVDPGITFDRKPFDGDPFARKGAITLRQPRVTFVSAKADVATVLNSLFNSAITNNLDLYLQRGAASAGTSTTGRVAAGTAQHIKITVAAGDWALDESSVQGTEDGQVSFAAMPTGTIAISTASTIP